MSFGAVNNVNRRLNIILAALPNFRRFLGMKGLPGDPFVLSLNSPMDPFVIELAMKLFITLVKHRSAEGFVFVVNGKWTVIVQGLPVCVKLDLYFNDEMLLL